LILRWQGWGFEAWSGAGGRLLDNVRFLAGYRRSLVIDASLLPVVLQAAREQATIGSVEQALAGEYPGPAGPPGGAAPAVDRAVAG
jgi:hypothetical protein